MVFMIPARLARHAHAISEATGLGGLWIGSVLLAAATSLPEILTDVTAALLEAPDIGVGDLFGSTQWETSSAATRSTWRSCWSWTSSTCGGRFSPSSPATIS
ncbi:MAG: hypothetical protein HYU42_10710 [Candidatus Rokubacteria bacterium]|nr:hypothetical protein [Candidatus Rokubacteria bacterium]MBI3107866.1 hypothetical protein [Candidatus Rokubacteria bacterium]